jgi:hypothetical protein
VLSHPHRFRVVALLLRDTGRLNSRKHGSLVPKIKAIDQNIATHAPRPVLKAIYRNLQRLICVRMKTARIRTATTNGITIVKFILEAQSMNGLSIQKTYFRPTSMLTSL